MYDRTMKHLGRNVCLCVNDLFPILDIALFNTKISNLPFYTRWMLSPIGTTIDVYKAFKNNCTFGYGSKCIWVTFMGQKNPPSWISSFIYLSEVFLKLKFSQHSRTSWNSYTMLRSLGLYYQCVMSSANCKNRAFNGCYLTHFSNEQT